MKNENLVFTKATKDDLKDIGAIELEFFKDYEKSFTSEFLEKWFGYNPDMFYVVKKAGLDTVGFIILTPVSEQLHNRIVAGEVFDFFDFPEADVLNSMQSDYFYVADICLSGEKKYSYLNAVIVLIGNMFRILADSARFITTCPVTEEGLKICHTLGMRKTAEAIDSESRYPIYLLEVTEDKINRFSKLMKRASR